MVRLFSLQFIAAPSTPNSNHKRGNRRARQNKTPGSDTIRLTGRQTLATVQTQTSGEPEYVVNLTPASLGDRIASVAGNFVRFRFKSLRFQYVSALPTTQGGILTYGVLDDAIPAGTNPETPLNRDQILNLRRATETAIWRNRSLSWRPLDMAKWYYVYQAAGTDRFTVPCSLNYMITDGSTTPGGTTGFIDVQYVIEFSGAAVTVLSNLSSSVPSSMVQSPRPLLKTDEIPGYVSVSRPLMSLRK